MDGVGSLFYNSGLCIILDDGWMVMGCCFILVVNVLYWRTDGDGSLFYNSGFKYY